MRYEDMSPEKQAEYRAYIRENRKIHKQLLKKFIGTDLGFEDFTREDIESTWNLMLHYYGIAQHRLYEIAPEDDEDE